MTKKQGKNFDAIVRILEQFPEGASVKDISQQMLHPPQANYSCLNR